MSNPNSHAGLSYGVANLRRPFAPPHTTASKSSPSLPQHASPYHQHPQTYQPQQHAPSQYPHHLFTSTPPQINNIASLQNATRPPPPQLPPSLPGPRQRAPAPRQMQQQTPPLSYLQQSLNQQPLGQHSMAQQSMPQQPLSQQSMAPQSMATQSMTSQSITPPSMTPQSLNAQPMNPQQLSQPSLSQQLQQPMSQPPLASSLTHQSMAQQSLNHSVQAVQQNDASILSQQSSSHSPAQPTLPPAQPQVQQAQKAQQVHQSPQIQHVQPTQQPPIKQRPASRQAEPVAAPHENNQEEDMEGVDHDDESGEGDTTMDPKIVDNTPFVPREPMGPMMSAPPEGGSFPTLEAIHKHVLGYCTSVGYAVVIGRSKKTVPGLKKVLFVCDRAGKPPKRVSPEMRKRKTTSRKCDCQFGFFAIEQRTQWTVRYRPDPAHLVHNHGPSESPLLHPAARKLDSKMVAAVKQLKDSGVGVSQTLEILQNANPHVPLLPRDIYNARAAINRNPEKIANDLAENRPAIYSKPHPSPEERIRADLRRELANARADYDKLKEESHKEIEDLKAKVREKDKIIEKFEQFIDICNQRVMVRLTNSEDSRAPGAPSS